MESGIVKKIVLDKGFGFIKADNGGSEFFFHRSAVLDYDFAKLKEGQRVSFTIGKGAKGPRAENVSIDSES